MLELEGHLEDRAFDDELLAIAQDLLGQQVLVHKHVEENDHALRLEGPTVAKKAPKESFMKILYSTTSKNFDLALKLEDPTVAKRGAKRKVHEPDPELLVNLRHDLGKPEDEFLERLDVCPASARHRSRPPRRPKSDP